MKKNKNKLKLKKTQITKILNPQKILGGTPVNNECSVVRTDETQPNNLD